MKQIVVERDADASMGLSLDKITEFEPLPVTSEQPVGAVSSD